MGETVSKPFMSVPRGEAAAQSKPPIRLPFPLLTTLPRAQAASHSLISR